ncbi:phytoene/squalene synthase family protein [Terrarubrum flagellatum]|uniref:phytoene/squalene synthase family protein n=1 Tax=Terrirubrum flagellatum TaxID=2895980 RepID=UPI003144FB3A
MSNMLKSDALAAAYAHCEKLVRDEDDDRWRATLFAPAEARPHLFALYAFSNEVARVRAQASDPMPGEIRHQWWRDALAGEARGDASAHPVAAALLDTVARFHLPVKALIDLIDARTFDLYDDPMPSLAQLEGYCGETSSALMRLASLVIAKGEDPGGADAVGHAGVAYALVGLMRSLPWHARRGQVYVPKEILDRHGVTRDDIVAGRGGPGLVGALRDLRGVARLHLENYRAQAPHAKPVVIACAAAALAEPYINAMERRSDDPLRAVVELSPFRKMWSLWRGRI